MKKLAIIGTREFGVQVLNYARNTGRYEVVGWIDDLEEVGNLICNLPVICNVENAVHYYNKGLFDFAFIAIGYSKMDIKQSVYNIIKGEIPLANIIAPSAIVSPTAILGEGILINDYVTIDKNTVVNDDVVLLGHTLLTHDCNIGKHCYIAGNNSIAGFVTIQDNVFIGLGAAISDHVSICSNTWVGIGCVVVESITVPGKYMSRAMSLIRV